MNYGIGNVKAKIVGNSGASFLTSSVDATYSNNTYTLALTNFSDTPKVDDYVAYIDNSLIQTLYKVSAIGSTDATLTKEGEMLDLIPLHAFSGYKSADGNKFTLGLFGGYNNTDYYITGFNAGTYADDNVVNMDTYRNIANNGKIDYGAYITYFQFTDNNNKKMFGLIGEQGTMQTQQVVVQFQQLGFYNISSNTSFTRRYAKINFNVIYYDLQNEQYLIDNNIEKTINAVQTIGLNGSSRYCYQVCNVYLKKGMILLSLSINSIEMYCCDNSFTKPVVWDGTREAPYSQY